MLLVGQRRVLQPGIDEGREQRTRALAVSFLPARQRRAQPDTIDHGGNHRGEAARLIARQQPPQRVPQIRQHAALVYRLHALQAFHVQDLSPESEPCRPGALIEFLRREVGVDHRLHAAARRAGEPDPLPHALPDAPRQCAEGGFEQAILVVEVMRDQSRRDAGPLRDLRQRAADVPDLGQAVDRDLDELLPARFFVACSRAVRRIAPARA